MKSGRTKIVDERDPKKESTADSAAVHLKGAAARTTAKADAKPSIPPPKDPSGDAAPDYPPEKEEPPAIPTRPADPEARPAYAPEPPPPAIAPRKE